MSEPTVSDLINARFDDPADVALNGRPYVEALRGVMREHRSVFDQGYYGDRRLCCNTCHRPYERPVWPCATVRAVAAAFGIDVPEETR